MFRHRTMFAVASAGAICTFMLMLSAAHTQEPKDQQEAPQLDRVADFYHDVPAREAWHRLRTNESPTSRELLAVFPLTMESGPGLSTQITSDGSWTTAWPEVVRSTLQSAALAQQAFRRGSSDATPSRLHSGAWRGSTWNGVELYVLQVPAPPTQPDDYVWTAYDPELNAVAAPLVGSARWMAPLGSTEDAALVQCDLDGDGRFEIGFPSFDHNGTVTNDSIRTYYSIAAKPFQLNEVLSFRRRQWLSAISPGESGHLHRVPCFDRENGMRLFVFYDNPAYGQSMLPLGFIEFAQSEAGQAWQKQGTRCLLPSFAYYLEP